MNALAAATGTAKTPQAVECEASQSDPKGNAQQIPPSPAAGKGRGGNNRPGDTHGN